MWKGAACGCVSVMVSVATMRTVNNLVRILHRALQTSAQASKEHRCRRIKEDDALREGQTATNTDARVCAHLWHLWLSAIRTARDHCSTGEEPTRKLLLAGHLSRCDKEEF